MITVDVALAERSYAISIAAGLAETCGEQLVDQLGGGRCLIIADEQVAALHGQRVQGALSVAGLDCALTTFPAGEASKTATTLVGLWQACADHAIDRSGAIIALGGGVSGDLAGFVASTWMRGIDFVQIPTSLLAMVDSSVGGKTGINAPAGKNLIGAFKQPRSVFIDPLLLTTMEEREYRAGLAEVLKYGVIRDPGFLSWQEDHAQALAEREPEALAEAVARSCRIKAAYVIEDEHEHGLRAHLNYGHTFGHALERETRYRQYLHGEAVAIGMRMAADCARRLGMLHDESLISRQDALLAAWGFSFSHVCDDVESCAGRLLDFCGLDKKVRAGRRRFVLPRGCGDVEIVEDPDVAAVREAFQAALSG